MMGGSLKLNLTYTIVTADTNGVLSWENYISQYSHSS
jgi:hypothetical protein